MFREAGVGYVEETLKLVCDLIEEVPLLLSNL